MVKKHTPSAPSVSAVCGGTHLYMKKERNRQLRSAKTIPPCYNPKTAKYRSVKSRGSRRRQAVLRPRQKSKSINPAMPHMLKCQKHNPSPQQPAALQSRLLFKPLSGKVRRRKPQRCPGTRPCCLRRFPCLHYGSPWHGINTGAVRCHTVSSPGPTPEASSFFSLFKHPARQPGRRPAAVPL